MYKVIITFLFLAFLNSCFVPRESKLKYSYCYKKVLVNIDSLININGIFFPENVISGLDTLGYDNAGYFAPKYVFYNNNMTTKNIPRNWYVPDKNYKIRSSNGGTWGMYQINEDTIKARYISCCGGQTNFIHSLWFKVIDRNTIEQVCCFEDKSGIYSTKIFKFVPHDSLPVSEESWLLKKKWFWCNKNEWKKYKHNLSKGTNGSKKHP